MSIATPVDAVMEFRRRDAGDKLTGRTRYTIDRGAPGMLHAAVLRARGRRRDGW